MDVKRMSGIIPAVVTAYDENGNLSKERLQNLYAFLINNGVSGLFVGGSTGEWVLLTKEERKLAAQLAVEVAAGKVPVVMHISSMIPEEVIEYAEWAAKIGVYAVSIVLPYYFTYDDIGMKRYFDRILPHINLPVLIYNIPGNVKNSLSVALLNQLAQEYEVVCGVKDSSMDFLKVEEFLHGVQKENFSVFTGNDAQILTGLMWGTRGGVSAAACAFPDIVTKMYRYFKNGELEKAKEIQNKLMDYRSFVVSNPALSVVKSALNMRGILVGDLRAPLHSLSETKEKELRQLLASLEFL